MVEADTGTPDVATTIRDVLDPQKEDENTSIGRIKRSNRRRSA
jgi:hypothetical protein